MNQVHQAILDAEALYRAGNYAAAAALLDPLSGPLATNQPPPAALRILGLCELRLGTPSRAVSLLERAYALAPDDPWCRLHYGIGLQSTGRHTDAAVLFRAAQTVLPDDPAPALNLSTALLSLGDPAGAIRAARKARLRGPAMPETHYALGLAYLAADLLDRAADCFRKATQLAPRFADAWVNLGVICYRKGEIEAAKHAMRTALAADPANQAAAANLGGFLRLTGETEASETLLRGVLQRHPNALAARINLAADLLLEDRAAEALELLDVPAPPGPAIRLHWLLQQSLALIKLGRLPEARTTLAALGPLPPALEPLLRWRQVLIALAENNTAQAHQSATEMEALLLQTPSILPEHRIMGHYDLAKFWSRQQQTDRAFPRWVAGHRLLAAFQPFSRQAYAAAVDATIASFDAARLAGARSANTDKAPVFIVGMPRSGTTLTEQILSAHAQVHGAGERMALGQAFWQLGGPSEIAAPARIAALDQPALDVAAEQYLRELHALDPQASRIVDKMPANFRHLGLMALMLPGAKVIACDRDPRDIGLSIFTFRFYGSHGYAHDLADLGWYIGQHRRLMAHWRAVLPNPIMTVRLRDWVEDFSGTLRRVLDFLDLPYDANCEQFHEVERRVRTVSRTQVREPVNARGLGRWRAYESHLAPLIAELRASGALDDVDPPAPGRISSGERPSVKSPLQPRAAKGHAPRGRVHAK